MALRAVSRRPVFLASYDDPAPAEVEKVRLRQDFPETGSDRYGGLSDGYCFRIVFAAGRLERSYDLLRQFLQEEGYEAVPVPADADELKKFRLPPKLRHQLSLFGEDGYVHNPLKILFPPQGGKRGAVILEIYNEAEAGHLLKFHRR